jgi:hypothetical protein
LLGAAETEIPLDPDSEKPIAIVEPECANRIGMATLVKLAFDGGDLRPLWRHLVGNTIDGTVDPGEALDLSLIAQLLGDKQMGLAIQREVLRTQRLFRSPRLARKPLLSILALAAATDMGSNTPIELLLEQSEIELMTLYVVTEFELPEPLPDHDVAIVIASDSDDCRTALDKIDLALTRWPRPLLNIPRHVCNLDRDKLYRLLANVEGLVVPTTIAVRREQLREVSCSAEAFAGISADLAFPIVIRPRGSHAGAGLAKVDDGAAMESYLAKSNEPEFFISRFVDYSDEYGVFRKYRIVFIDGRAYACHMAIAERWDIWYLNAGMAACPGKRLEEETFMRTFDIGFANRHRTALAALVERVGLDYFTIDCAETVDGSLLIFEADNTAVVHNMDSPEIFPYKAPQMQKIFDAFAAMLQRRTRCSRDQAA